MGLFKKKKIEDRNYSTSLNSLFHSNFITMNEDDALRIPAVKNSVELISGSIASLPVYLYREEDGQVVRVFNDKREFLLNNEPNFLETSYNLKKKMVKDFILHGGTYSLLEKAGLNIDAIYNVSANTITAELLVNDRGIPVGVDYKFALNGKPLTADITEMLVCLDASIDGATTKRGILKDGQKLLNLMNNEIDVHNSFLENGAVVKAVLQTEGKIGSDKTLTRLKESLKGIYSGAKNAGKTMILEEGLKFVPIQNNMDEIKMVDSKKHNIAETEKLFNLPAGFLQDNQRRSSEDNLVYLQRTLMPIITALEESFNKSLLLESEKENNYFFRFDVSEILRATQKEMVEMLSKGVESGLYTLNEARAVIDKPKFGDNDFLLFNLGHVVYKKDGTMVIPNMAQSLDTNETQNNIDEDL